MKHCFKMILACFCAAFSVNAFSQVQQYIRASVNGGISTLQYSSDDLSSEVFSPSSLGGGAAVEYYLFFNKYVGVSAGGGISVSQSQYELNGSMSKEMEYYSKDDKLMKNFVYKVDFTNWVEKQTVCTVDVPVGIVGKCPFSDKITGMANVGVKLQLPIKASYKVADGSQRSSNGIFEDQSIVFPTIPQSGYHSTDHALKGDLYTEDFAFAAYLDLGVMQKIGSQHLYYGLYGQCGFTQFNINTSNEYLTQFGIYNSPLNTTLVDKIRLVSFAVKLGYVLPLGRNKDKSINSVSE